MAFSLFNHVWQLHILYLTLLLHTWIFRFFFFGQIGRTDSSHSQMSHMAEETKIEYGYSNSHNCKQYKQLNQCKQCKQCETQNENHENHENCDNFDISSQSSEYQESRGSTE